MMSEESFFQLGSHCLIASPEENYEAYGNYAESYYPEFFGQSDVFWQMFYIILSKSENITLDPALTRSEVPDIFQIKELQKRFRKQIAASPFESTVIMFEEQLYHPSFFYFSYEENKAIDLSLHNSIEVKYSDIYESDYRQLFVFNYWRQSSHQKHSYLEFHFIHNFKADYQKYQYFLLDTAREYPDTKNEIEIFLQNNSFLEFPLPKKLQKIHIANYLFPRTNPDTARRYMNEKARELGLNLSKDKLTPMEFYQFIRAAKNAGIELNSDYQKY